MGRRRERKKIDFLGCDAIKASTVLSKFQRIILLLSSCCRIQQDGSVNIHRQEKLKSYNFNNKQERPKNQRRQVLYTFYILFCLLTITTWLRKLIGETQ